MRRRSHFHRPPAQRTPGDGRLSAPDIVRYCLAVLLIVLFGLICIEAEPRSFEKLLPILVPPLMLVLHYYFGRRER